MSWGRPVSRGRAVPRRVQTPGPAGALWVAGARRAEVRDPGPVARRVVRRRGDRAHAEAGGRRGRVRGRCPGGGAVAAGCGRGSTGPACTGGVGVRSVMGGCRGAAYRAASVLGCGEARGLLRRVWGPGVTVWTTGESACAGVATLEAVCGASLLGSTTGLPRPSGEGGGGEGRGGRVRPRYCWWEAGGPARLSKASRAMPRRPGRGLA